MRCCPSVRDLSFLISCHRRLYALDSRPIQRLHRPAMHTTTMTVVDYLLSQPHQILDYFIKLPALPMKRAEFYRGREVRPGEIIVNSAAANRN